VASWISAPRLQWVQPRGWFFPRLRPLSIDGTWISLPRWLRLLFEDDCIGAVTHLLLCWPSAAQPPRPAPRSQLGGGKWTPQRLAWNLLQPLLRWVHLPPGTSLWISCIVHNWLSTKYDYQPTCTTRERCSLTSSTEQQSRTGRQVCW
jgi:hypothetical protein